MRYTLAFLILAYPFLILASLSPTADAQGSADRTAYSFAAWAPGTYTVTITVADDGAITLLPFTVIAVPTLGTVATDPDDPMDPSDPLAQRVEAIVASAPPLENERKAVSELLKLASRTFPTGKGARRGTWALFASLLPKFKDTEAWAGWKESVEALAIADDDVKAFWNAVSKGLVE